MMSGCYFRGDLSQHSLIAPYLSGRLLLSLVRVDDFQGLRYDTHLLTSQSVNNQCPCRANWRKDGILLPKALLSRLFIWLESAKFGHWELHCIGGLRCLLLLRVHKGAITLIHVQCLLFKSQGSGFTPDCLDLKHRCISKPFQNDRRALNRITTPRRLPLPPFFRRILTSGRSSSLLRTTDHHLSSRRAPQVLSTAVEQLRVFLPRLLQKHAQVRLLYRQLVIGGLVGQHLGGLIYCCCWCHNSIALDGSAAVMVISGQKQRGQAGTAKFADSLLLDCPIAMLMDKTALGFSSVLELILGRYAFSGCL